MRLFLISIVSLSLVSPALEVAAQSNPEAFYECTKRGEETVFVNSGTVETYRRQGMLCKVVFQAGSKEAKASSSKGGASKGRSNYRPPRIGEPKVGPKQPTKESERLALYRDYINEASSKYQIPQDFIAGVIRVESNFNYRAVSSAGAQGLMQLMPRTGRSMGVSDPFDPRQNILGGARLLRVLANRFDGDIIKVLSAYHAGTGAVKAKGGIPYQDTEGYVRSVLDHYYRYQADSSN